MTFYSVQKCILGDLLKHGTLLFFCGGKKLINYIVYLIIISSVLLPLHRNHCSVISLLSDG